MSSCWGNQFACRSWYGPQGQMHNYLILVPSTLMTDIYKTTMLPPPTWIHSEIVVKCLFSEISSCIHQRSFEYKTWFIGKSHLIFNGRPAAKIQSNSSLLCWWTAVSIGALTSCLLHSPICSNVHWTVAKIHFGSPFVNQSYQLVDGCTSIHPNASLQPSSTFAIYCPWWTTLDSSLWLVSFCHTWYTFTTTVRKMFTKSAVS